MFFNIFFDVSFDMFFDNGWRLTLCLSKFAFYSHEQSLSRAGGSSRLPRTSLLAKNYPTGIKRKGMEREERDDERKKDGLGPFQTAPKRRENNTWDANVAFE